jgi:hypothetical protein
VPDERFEALIPVKPPPAPLTVVNVPTLAVNDPLASLATIVEAPLAEAAVVAELGMLVSPEPDPVNEAPVIAPAVNSPEVPRRTIVDAPFAVAAVVLAFATVPVVTFDPLIALIAEPLAVIIFAVNEPLTSLETIVLAPLASEAVVLALAIVPLDMLEALIAVKATPFPDTAVNEPVAALTTLAAKEPFASRAIIVLAPLADAAVVLALDIVPVEMFDAFMSDKPAPFPLCAPDTETKVPTFPAKEPLASLRTKVEAPLADAPVVRALAIVPVETLEALIALMAAPSPVNEAPVIAPAENSPDVPRSTIVDAPLAVAAVVRALAIVPDDMFDALIAEIDPPPPLKFVAVITFPENDPLASRKTKVAAVAASVPVVLAFAIVPEEMFEALIAVRDVPLPDMLVKVPVVPVITFPEKDPLASRATIVEAPLAEAAVVLALSKVPVVIAVALIAVRAEPLPENDVPVIAPAANSPEAPRRTIVEAPLLEEAVVLAFATVPVVTLDPLIAETLDPSPIKKLAVIASAAKSPLASRKTMVEAPFDALAVVLAFAMVPDEMLEALIADSVAPLPLNVAVIMFAPKLPSASRRTIVLALFAVLPVVRALDIVPLVMFEALMSVRPAALAVMLVKLPVVALTVVAVITLALNEPLASRNTIVLAPFDALAVVRSLLKVPTVMFDTLIAELAAEVN